LEDAHRERQHLCDRYNSLRDHLELAAGSDAAAALFLPHVEGCTRAVTQFVAVSHPLSTLAHYVAGQQLMQAKNWQNQMVAAAKKEWKTGKPPAEVLIAIMQQQGVEHQEATARVLEMIQEVEHWWATLQQNDEEDVPAPATGDEGLTLASTGATSHVKIRKRSDAAKLALTALLQRGSVSGSTVSEEDEASPPETLARKKKSVTFRPAPKQPSSGTERIIRGRGGPPNDMEEVMRDTEQGAGAKTGPVGSPPPSLPPPKPAHVAAVRRRTSGGNLGSPGAGAAPGNTRL
jgi:hypothetical protein